MVLRFQFENFGSFRDLQTISWLATKLKDTAHDPINLERNKLRVLPIAAIYGANASGKSSVLNALKFFQEAVVRSYRRWIPGRPIHRNRFLGASPQSTGPSKFILDFLHDDSVFQYGFELDDERIRSEWLWGYPNGRRQIWFTRNDNGTLAFGASLKGPKKVLSEINGKQSLFLSTAAQADHIQLAPIHVTIARGITFRRRSSFSRVSDMVARQFETLSRSDGKKAAIIDLLKMADFGVTDLQVREERKHLLGRTPTVGQGSLFDSNTEKEHQEADDYSIRKFVVLKHLLEGQEVELDEESESDGTKQYISHLPQLIRTLSAGGLHVIDELDSSLHPLLCRALVAPFASASMNTHNAQLLFTTHDATLLSGDILRRDEVWLTEKAISGVSRLFSLADYAPRKEENIEKGYLQGRYRGVPELSSLAVARETLLSHE